MLELLPPEIHSHILAYNFSLPDILSLRLSCKRGYDLVKDYLVNLVPTKKLAARIKSKFILTCIPHLQNLHPLYRIILSNPEEIREISNDLHLRCVTFAIHSNNIHLAAKVFLEEIPEYPSSDYKYTFTSIRRHKIIEFTSGEYRNTYYDFDLNLLRLWIGREFPLVHYIGYGDSPDLKVLLSERRELRNITLILTCDIKLFLLPQVCYYNLKSSLPTTPLPEYSVNYEGFYRKLCQGPPHKHVKKFYPIPTDLLLDESVTIPRFLRLFPNLEFLSLVIVEEDHNEDIKPKILPYLPPEISLEFYLPRHHRNMEIAPFDGLNGHKIYYC
jgi:hypothetical protein